MKVVLKKVIYHWAAALLKLTYNYNSVAVFPFTLFLGPRMDRRKFDQHLLQGLWQVPQVVSSSKQAPTLLHAMLLSLLRLGSWRRRRRGAFEHVGLGGLEGVSL